ncbi:unnamed protein product [Trichogramma brassicae]|uniref:Uncharacterized protein n=1 Tax=Trichogramma brassicae TaxID=86971 RepID=A0A6H5IP01_9HYME|nr:unnamed protein product [Trichogramma brassicae]
MASDTSIWRSSPKALKVLAMLTSQRPICEYRVNVTLCESTFSNAFCSFVNYTRALNLNQLFIFTIPGHHKICLRISLKVMFKVKSKVTIGFLVEKYVGKGIPHCCRGASSTAVRDNVSNFVEKLPEMQQNQILTSLLKRRLTDSKDNDIILNTSGAKMRVILNPKPEQNVVFTAESLDNFQTATGVTRNHMNKMEGNPFTDSTCDSCVSHGYVGLE